MQKPETGKNGGGSYWKPRFTTEYSAGEEE
jgi:hypothetical protein